MKAFFLLCIDKIYLFWIRICVLYVHAFTLESAIMCQVHDKDEKGSDFIASWAKAFYKVPVYWEHRFHFCELHSKTPDLCFISNGEWQGRSSITNIYVVFFHIGSSWHCSVSSRIILLVLSLMVLAPREIVDTSSTKGIPAGIIGLNRGQLMNRIPCCST